MTAPRELLFLPVLPLMGWLPEALDKYACALLLAPRVRAQRAYASVSRQNMAKETYSMAKETY